MDARTVIATKPKTYRTSLGCAVTVRKIVEDSAFVWHEIVLECPIELVEPGKTWSK